MVCLARRLVRRFPYREGRQDRTRVGRENDYRGRRNDKHDALQPTARVRIDESPTGSVNLVGDSKLVTLGTAGTAAVLRNADVPIPVGKQPVNLIGHRRQGWRDRASHISAEDRTIAEGYARCTCRLWRLYSGRSITISANHKGLVLVHQV